MTNVFTERLLKSREADLSAAEAKQAAADRTTALYQALASRLEEAGLAEDLSLVPKSLVCTSKPRSGLYDADGNLVYLDVDPDLALRLLGLFSPVPVYDATDGTFRAHIPYWCQTKLDEYAKRRNSEQTVTCGVMLRAERLVQYESKISLEWYSEVGGFQLHFRAELTNIKGITPEVSFRADHYMDGSVKRITGSSLKFPVGQGSLFTERRFASGGPQYIPGRTLTSQNIEQFFLWLGAMAARIQCNKAEADAAYEADREAGRSEPNSKTRSPTLNAGTVEQDACLSTPEACRDLYLAKHHWRVWLERNLPDLGPGYTKAPDYFTYHTWACHWLAQHNLLVVDYEGKPYKYGTAWLPA